MAHKLSDHEKEKGCWFVAVSHDIEERDKLKTTCKEFKFWGWVDHQPDKETEESDKHFHTHFIVLASGSRSVLQVAQVLGIPANFVQVCRNKRSMMRYFRHLDNPEKIQYSAESVHASSLSNFRIAWEDNSDDDVKRLFHDLDRYMLGKISFNQFVDLHYLEVQKMPFYQKIKTYTTLKDVKRGAGTT